MVAGILPRAMCCLLGCVEFLSNWIEILHNLVDVAWFWVVLWSLWGSVPSWRCVGVSLCVFPVQWHMVCGVH